MDDIDLNLLVKDLESDSTDLLKSIDKDLEQQTQTIPIEEYENIKKVGQGTFGEVFKVREKRTNKIYAVKRLRTEKEVEGVGFLCVSLPLVSINFSSGSNYTSTTKPRKYSTSSWNLSQTQYVYSITCQLYF